MKFFKIFFVINILLSLFLLLIFGYMLLMTPFLFDDPNAGNSPYPIIAIVLVFFAGTLASIVVSSVAFRKKLFKKAWIVSGLVPVIVFALSLGLSLLSPIISSEKQFLSKAPEGSDFPSIKFYHHESWAVEEKPESLNGKVITFTKNGHILRIAQVIYVGGGGCLYEDTPASALDLPAMDFRGQDYKEYTTTTGFTRYAPSPYNEDKNKIVYEFCQPVPGERQIFAVPFYGSTTLEVPVEYDEKTFKEALEIVRTMDTTP